MASPGPLFDAGFAAGHKAGLLDAAEYLEEVGGSKPVPLTHKIADIEELVRITSRDALKLAAKGIRMWAEKKLSPGCDT